MTSKWSYAMTILKNKKWINQTISEIKNKIKKKKTNFILGNQVQFYNNNNVWKDLKLTMKKSQVLVIEGERAKEPKKIKNKKSNSKW